MAFPIPSKHLRWLWLLWNLDIKWEILKDHVQTMDHPVHSCGNISNEAKTLFRRELQLWGPSLGLLAFSFIFSWNSWQWTIKLIYFTQGSLGLGHCSSPQLPGSTWTQKRLVAGISLAAGGPWALSASCCHSYQTLPGCFPDYRYCLKTNQLFGFHSHCFHCFILGVKNQHEPLILKNTSQFWYSRAPVSM